MGYGIGPIFNHHKFRCGYTLVGSDGEQFRPPVMFKELGVSWQRDFVMSGNQKQIVKFLRNLGDIPVTVPKGQKFIYVIIRQKAAKIRDEFSKAFGGAFAFGGVSGAGSMIVSNIGEIARYGVNPEQLADGASKMLNTLVKESTSLVNNMQIGDTAFDEWTSRARGPHAIIRLSAAKGGWSSHDDSVLVLPVKGMFEDKIQLTAANLGRIISTLSY
ncbi:hypothetical protein DRV85_06035 [Rhodosalinus halophilus]|uniref:Uncharacterized protein n=1 Tax=Rhodosalinus halophilus TaxID=2259333 RepID=A0A365UAU7_9RHOB|nr:hypothetical protein [Rhodosalinus halophilus]RBI86305.1 hypothetical protein DRV85_06035 [Rhodosalinus halophilus]